MQLPAPKPTISDLRNLHLELIGSTRKRLTYVSVEKAWRRVIVPSLGDGGLLASVERRDVRLMHASHARTPAAANFALTTLRYAFYLAEDEGWRAPGTNPCTRVKPHRTPSIRRPLSVEETRALWAAVVACVEYRLAVVLPSMAAAYLLVLATGMRTREATRIPLAAIDLERGFVHIAEHKTDADGPKTVAIMDEALPVLRRYAATCDAAVPFAFPNPRTGRPFTDVSKAWRRLCEYLNLTDGPRAPQIRDARSGLATNGLEAGEELRVIQAQLGHRDIKTTAKYAQVTRHRARVGVRNIGRALLGPRGGPSDDA